MKVPISLKSLEMDIETSARHLEFLRKASNFHKEMSDYFETKEDQFPQVLDIGLLNAHCLVTTIQLEISILLKNLQYGTNKVEIIHLLKNGVRILYESIQSLDKSNKILFDVTKDNLQSEGFKQYTVELKEFKRGINFNGKIRAIRNNVSGHKMGQTPFELVRKILLI